MRRELLDAYLFDSLAEVRSLSEEWRMDYNTERPHKSLGYLSPYRYAEQYANDKALSTPASETSKQIEAMPVVDNAVESKTEFIFENSN
jgi:putative transposase